MILIGVTILLTTSVITNAIPTPNQQPHRNTDCPSIMTLAGFNTSVLAKAASHGIHSITVKDIRRYFDTSFPKVNDIPTVNSKLDDRDLVLPSAPFGSEFETPGMGIMDRVLSNDDGSDNFMIQGLTPMEKIAHGMHMIELWEKASHDLKKIKADPPSSKVCSCAVDETGNGMLEELNNIAMTLRTFSDQHRTNMCFNFWEITLFSYNCKAEDSSKDVDLTKMPKMPELQDSKSWATWKPMLKGSMPNDNEIHHFAMYLYCKINALEKN